MLYVIYVTYLGLVFVFIIILFNSCKPASIVMSCECFQVERDMMGTIKAQDWIDFLGLD